MLFVNANNLEVASFYVSSDLKVELINDQKNLVFCIIRTIRKRNFSRLIYCKCFLLGTFALFAQGICQLPERVDGSMLQHKRQHKAGVLRKDRFEKRFWMILMHLTNGEQDEQEQYELMTFKNVRKIPRFI